MNIYLVVTQSGDEYDEDEAYTETPGIEAFLDKENAFKHARKARKDARADADEGYGSAPSISVVEVRVKDAPAHNTEAAA